MSPNESERFGALFLAGHPALDFLNTRMRVNGDLVDVLQNDGDVITWLRQAGFPAPAIDRKEDPKALLYAARKLREGFRSLIEKRKTEKRGDPSILNSFLAASPSYRQLVWSKTNKLTMDTMRQIETAESILTPIAEAAASLLATADFRLVKRCEGDSCDLWFIDQTKSHRRRWCSMETCGNRHKVAAYRKRRHDRRASH